MPIARPRLASCGAPLLGLVLLGSLLPIGVDAAGPLATSEPAADTTRAIRPTIQYEEAQAHAADRIAFTPGGRVSIPFSPRADDRWTIDGAPSRALPAGRLSGTTMLAADATGDGPAAAGTVDAPLRAEAVVHPDALVDPGGLKREVFGFLPYWELTDPDTRFDWETLSTVAYFGVGADGAGNLQKRDPDGSATVGWGGWTSAPMTTVINAAHASRARVVLTVQSFAWSSSGLTRQRALLGSSTARARLAGQIASAVHDRGADGVNLDFEPIASGYADEFTALVRSVRSALDAKASGYQLTFDTTGWIGNYPIAAATARGGADAVFVMGYDYRSSSSATVGSIDPIGGPTYDVRDTLVAYLDQIPASKVILGVPYYGRAWSTSTSALGARNTSGTKYGASASVTYAIAHQYAVDHGRAYDPVEGVAWTAYKRQNCTTTYGCVTSWRQLYYDDATALSAKYDLVNGYGLRGVGIWALGYDGTRPELSQALKTKFVTDTVPPAISAGSVSAAAFSPNADGTTDTTTARLTVTGLTTWGYTVRPLSGGTAGAAIRSGTQTGKTPAFTWDGTDAAGAGVADGSYLITLWAEDVSHNRSSRSFTVVLDTRPPVIRQSLAAVTFSPDGDRHADTVLMGWTASDAVTGTVRLRTASGTTLRSWSVTHAASWSTTWTGTDAAGRAVPDGSYTFRVDGRDVAGNLTVAQRIILVDRTIRSVGWTASSFVPSAKQTTRVVVDLRRQARITVAIYRGNTLVRTVWTSKAAAAGQTRWTWDGRSNAHVLVAAGEYRVVVTATSVIGTTRYSKGVTVRAQ